MGRNGDIFDFHFDTEKFKFYLKIEIKSYISRFDGNFI